MSKQCVALSYPTYCDTLRILWSFCFKRHVIVTKAANVDRKKLSELVKNYTRVAEVFNIMAAKVIDVALLLPPGMGLTPLGNPVEIRYLRKERSQAAEGKQLYAG